MRKTQFNHKKLLKRRLEMSLKVSEVAKQLSITTDGYRVLENGERKMPRANTLAEIAKALNVDMNYFFGN